MTEPRTSAWAEQAKVEELDEKMTVGELIGVLETMSFRDGGRRTLSLDRGVRDYLLRACRASWQSS